MLRSNMIIEACKAKQFASLRAFNISMYIKLSKKMGMCCSFSKSNSFEEFVLCQPLLSRSTFGNISF